MGSEMTLQAEVQVGPQGRLVIPAQMRKAMNLQPGELLIARVENDSLVLEKADAVKRRLKARFSHLPSELSLAEELIKDRRDEVDEDAST